MNSEKLWDLFNACDADGSGYIGRDEVRDICSKFSIETEDADAIFENLDRDRDGQISFDDFKEGFTDYERDFSANPLADKMRLIRLSTQDPNNNNNPNNQESNDLLSVDSSRHASNLKRVRSFTRRINRALEAEEPIEPEKQAKMIEELMDSLKKLKEENETLAKSYLRERREHEEHLYRIEQDVDSQVRQVEQRVTERAKLEIEAEKRSLRDMMKDEMLQLQAHLSMFEKVENWLKNSHSAMEKEQLGEFKNKLEEALSENHQMRLSLLDTQTTVAMMRSELGQLKTLYEQRCKELNQEREKVLEVVHNQDYLSRQLMVLQDANHRFQEIADNMQDSEAWGPNSLPSTSSNHHEHIPQRMKKGSIVGDYLGLNVDKRSMISRNLSQLEETIIREEDSRQGKSSSNDSTPWNDENDSGLSTITRDDQDEMTFPSTSSLSSPIYSRENNSSRDKLSPENQANDNSRCSSAIGSMVTPTTATTPTPPDDHNSPDIPSIREVAGPGESLYNLIFIGDMAVGKTALIYRLAQNQFLVNLCSTVGVDFHVKSYCVDNSKTITVQLWDTGGQERFRSITLSYFRKADGVILVYDLTLPKTFLNARNWMNQIKECSDREIPCVLVGNKLDLRDPNASEEDQISYNRGYKLAEEFNCPFFEISAKHGVNVMKALEAIIRKMMENDVKKGLVDPKAVVKLDAKSGFWAKKKCSTC